MGFDKTWNQETQFRKHTPNQRVQALADAVAPLALNAFGNYEAVAVYKEGRDSTSRVEMYCDVDLYEIKMPDGTKAGQVIGIQLLCPKCGQSLYVPTKWHTTKSTGRDVKVALMDPGGLVRCEDGYRRPKLSIYGGPVFCDYSMGEVNGLVSDRPVKVPCTWGAEIMDGIAYPAQKARLVTSSTGL